MRRKSTRTFCIHQRKDINPVWLLEKVFRILMEKSETGALKKQWDGLKCSDCWNSD